MRNFIFTLCLTLAFGINLYALEINIKDLNGYLLSDNFLKKLYLSLKEKNEIDINNREKKNHYIDIDNKKLTNLRETEKKLKLFLIKYEINDEEEVDYEKILRKVINTKLKDYRTKYVPIKVLSSIEIPITEEDKKKTILFMLNSKELLKKINLIEISSKEIIKDNKIISSIIKNITKGRFVADNLGDCVNIIGGKKVMYYQLSYYKYFPLDVYQDLTEKKEKYYTNRKYSHIIHDTTLKDNKISKINISSCSNITNQLPTYEKTKESLDHILEVINTATTEAQKEVSFISTLKERYKQCNNFKCISQNIKKEIYVLNQQELSGEKIYIEEKETSEIKIAIKHLLETILNKLQNDIGNIVKYKEESVTNFSYLNSKYKEKQSLIVITSFYIQPYYYLENGSTKVGVFARFKYKIKDKPDCKNIVEGYKTVKIGGYKITFVKANNKYISSVEIPFKVLEKAGRRKWDFIDVSCYKKYKDELKISEETPIVCIKDVKGLVSYLEEISGVDFDIPECEYMASLITCNNNYPTNICKEEGCYSNFGDYFVKVDYKKSLNSIGLYNLVGNAYEYCKSGKYYECIGGSIFEKDSYIKESSSMECFSGLAGIRLVIE